jgi:hypothetical protein
MGRWESKLELLRSASPALLPPSLSSKLQRDDDEEEQASDQRPPSCSTASTAWSALLRNCGGHVGSMLSEASHAAQEAPEPSLGRHCTDLAVK